MIRKLIYKILERRHYWRYVSFSEVAELYASRTLRTLAVSMVSVFIGVYLYQNGYNLTFIMGYFATYFLYRSMLTIPFAFVVAKLGPKRSTLLSNFLYVPALLMLVELPQYGIWALAGGAFFQGMSVALYDMSYLVSFSKVKNDENAGKELGYMHMLEQLAKGLSPVIGGFIAYFIHPQATLFFASMVFGLAALPLFFSPDSVKANQRITYYGLPWRKLSGVITAELAIGFDFIASGVLWSLFVALSVFGVGSNAIYAELGVLVSVTVFVGIITARLFGMLVDRRRGNELLTTGVVANSLTHISRIFVVTPFSVLLTNIANEIATTSYALPFTKGLFAQADDLPGYRIVFMSIASGSAALGAATFCLIMMIVTLFFKEVPSLQLGFVIVALVVPVITQHGFKRYLKPRLFL